MEDFKRKTNNIFGIKETLKNQLNILGAEITNITTFRAYADWLDTWTDNLYKKIRDITVLSHNGLYGKTSNQIIPSEEYTQIDCISNNASNYIDTRIALGDNFKVEFDFILNEYRTSEQPVASTWTNGNGYWNLFIRPSNAGTNANLLDLYVSGHHNLSSSAISLGEKNSVTIERIGNTWKTTLNGEKTTFAKTNYPENNTTVKLFTRGDINGNSAVSFLKIKIYNNDILVRDFIPCFDNQNNEVGLYDIKNKLFYRNEETGSFTYNNILPTPEYPLEVKTFSGEQTVTIEGTNIFNFDYFTDTSSGLTTIINGNNLKVTGTATSTQKYVTNYIQKPFERGKYVFSISKELPLRFILRFYNNGSTMFSFNIMPGQTSTVIDLDEPVEQYRLILNPTSDTTYNIDVDVKLEKGEEIENKSFPVSLKSKNLFDNTTSTFSNPNRVNITTTTDTITITTVVETTSNNLFFRAKIPDYYLENGKTYTLSSENVSGAAINLKIQLRNKDGSNANKSMGYSIVYDSNYSLYVVGNIFSGNASDVIPSGTTAIIKNVQVEKSSEATEYEPFYDIELCDIGGYQDILYRPTGEGKNLFDSQNVVVLNANLSNSKINSSPNERVAIIKCEPNTTYTFSKLMPNSYKRNTIATTRGYPTIDMEIEKVEYSGTSPKTYTTNSNAQYIVWLYWSSSDPTYTEQDTLDSMQIEKGSEATEYEEFTAGKWRMVKYTGKIVLDGSEDWSKSSNTSVDRFLRSSTIPKATQGISNYFNVVTSLGTNVGTFYFNERQQVVNYSTYGTTTLATFKTWLETNKPIVYYVLANPVEKTLTEEEYPTLYKQLNDINDYLIKRFIKKEFLAELDKPVIKENS